MPPITDILVDRSHLFKADWRDMVLLPFVRCKPRILIVVDGLTYDTSDGFGLTRFIQAITDHPAVFLKPVLTLAHRGGSTTPVSIYGTSYPVKTGFNFSTATPAVTIANFDQIWMFGIQPNGAANAFLTDPEIAVIADFMNAGGGVFSTGDHAQLGAGMGNRLPRIRHMREWSAIPMGTEALPGVRDRIDTVVNPGTNDLFEFNDQADDIPQRIYPNYSVTGPNPGWSATIHPVLRVGGGVTTRTGPADFTNDMDVLPDHPHESVCYEVSGTAKPAAFTGTYTEAGKNFQEFPFASGSTTQRIGASIVAYAVSGGRAVLRGAGVNKPPVNPRMFGINAAFDGHAATPYANNSNRNPGRIIVDSTWHHFVNVNLDGTSTSRTGLGTGSGGSFAPSAALLKIYRYYRNMVDWLQPANRLWCSKFIEIIDVSFSHLVWEEAISLPIPPRPSDILMIGQLAAAELDARLGPDTARDTVLIALRTHDKGAALAEQLSLGEGSEIENKFRTVVAMAIGQAVVDLVRGNPNRDPSEFAKRIKKGHEQLEGQTRNSVVSGAFAGLEREAKRTEEQSAVLKRFSALVGKRK